MSESASCGARERARCGVDDGQMRENPKRQRDGDDDGSGHPNEDARAVEQAQAERVESGHAVLRQLEDEGRIAGAEDGALEQARGGECGDEAGDVEAEHDDGAQADDSVQEVGVGNEGGDEQQIDGQARGAGHERRDQDGGEAVALVFDGARGHDGWNGAGVSREQRDEGLCHSDRWSA